MLLELGQNRPFWFLPEAQISFTVDDPGPKEIDTDGLDDTGKIAINTAISYGYLKKSSSVEIVRPDVKVEVDNAPVDGRVVMLRKQAQSQLKGSAKTIITFCKRKNTGSQMLSQMLNIEQNGQKRKTVIKAIEEVLSKTGGISAVVEDVTDQEEVKINID